MLWWQRHATRAVEAETSQAGEAREGGEAMNGLGRRYAPDDRDRRFPMRLVLPSTIAPGTRHYPPGPVLDQGNTGTCVGQAWRGWLNGAPLMTKTGQDAFSIYDQCIVNDEWSDNDVDPDRQFGTSVRAGAKVLQAAGHVSSYVWAYRVEDVRAFLLSGQGTLVFGTNWYNGMFDVDRNGFVNLTGRIAGGHAYKATGWSDTQEAVRCQNSWGTGFGQKGRFWLRANDLQRLLDEQGEACAAVERKVTPVT